MPQGLEALLGQMDEQKSSNGLEALLSGMDTTGGSPAAKSPGKLPPVPGTELLYPEGNMPGAATFTPNVKPVATGVTGFLGLPSSWDETKAAASRVAKKATENVSTWMQAASEAGAYSTELPVTEPVSMQKISDYAKKSQLPMVPFSEAFTPGSFGHGVAAGAESLTSPAATVALGGIAAAQFVPGLNVALNSALAYTGGAAVGGELYQMKEAYDKGDLDQFAEHAGLGTFDTFLAALMIRAAARGAVPVAEKIRTSMGEWKATRRNNAIAEAERRVKELFPESEEPPAITPVDEPSSPGSPGGGGPAGPEGPAPPKPGAGGSEEAGAETRDVVNPDGTVSQVKVKTLEQQPSLLDSIIDSMEAQEKPPVEPPPSETPLLDAAAKATEEQPPILRTEAISRNADGTTEAIPFAWDAETRSYIPEAEAKPTEVTIPPVPVSGEQTVKDSLTTTPEETDFEAFLAALKEVATEQEGGGPEEKSQSQPAVEPGEGIVTEPPAPEPDRAEPPSMSTPSDDVQNPEPPDSKSVQGKPVRVRVPNQKEPIQANYELMDLADVKTSHNPFNWQANPDYGLTNDRDYSQAGNSSRVISHSDPSRVDEFIDYVITPSPTAEHGFTLVDSNGNALGGNNRAMALRRIYDLHPEAAKKFKAALKENAQQFGFTPEQIDAVKDPYIVRRLQSSPKTEAQNAVTDFNKKASADLSPEERAVSDGRRLSPASMKLLVNRLEDNGEDASLADALRGTDAVEVIHQLQKDGVLTEEEQNGMLDSRDQLTPAAKGRIAAMLVGRLFQDSKSFSRVKPEMRGKLERIAPQVLRVETREGWSIGEPLADALAILEDAQSRGVKNLDDLAGQESIGDTPEYSEKALAIAKTLQQSPVKAAAAFRRYANDEALSREGAQASMFEPPTQEEAFADAFVGSRTMAVVRKHGHIKNPGKQVVKQLQKERNQALQPVEDFYNAHDISSYVKEEDLNEGYEGGYLMAKMVLEGKAPGDAEMAQAAVDAWESYYQGEHPSKMKAAENWAESVSKFDDDLIPHWLMQIARYEPQPVSDGLFQPIANFDGRAPLKELADSVETSATDTERPIVYINEPAGEIVRRMLGMEQEFGALYVHAGERDRLLSKLELTNQPTLSRLAADIRKASQGKDNVILVRGDFPRKHIEISIVHEGIHSVQMDLAKQINASYHVSGAEGRTILDRTPNGRGIARMLIEDGYADNPRVLVEEVAAYVFSGEAWRLGMSDEDVVDFFDAYTDVLIAKYGDQVHERFGSESAEYKETYEKSRVREKARQLGDGQTERGTRRDGETPKTEGFWERIKRAGQTALEELRGSVAPRAWRPPLTAREIIQTSYDKEILPRLEELKVSVPDATKAFVNSLSPRTGTPRQGLDTIYEMKGKREKMLFLLDKTMGGIREMFSEMTQDDCIDFMDRMKTGQAQRTPELQRVANIYRQIDDGMYDLLKHYRPDLNYKEDHFRIFWKKIPGPTAGAAGQEKEFKGLSNRPIEGTRGMLRKATLVDVSEGIDRGGIPFSYNPQVLLEMSVADSMKYITAHRMWDKLGEIGFRKFVRAGGEPPVGYAKLDDRIARVVHPEQTESGRTVPIHEGDWYVEENVQRLLSNFLSRDWFRTGPFVSVTRPMLAIKNAITGLELSISPFHAMFETIEAVASQVGLGVTRVYNQGIVQGDTAALKQGLKDIAAAPLAPAAVSRLGTNVIRYVENAEQFKKTARGAKFIKDWPEIDAIIDDLFSGGAKLAQNEEFRLQTYRAMKEAYAEGNWLGAAMRAIPALNEKLMHPLFEIYIPRLKIGFFLREYSQQLEQNHQDLAAGTMTRTQLAREVWDRVENRFGEMNFDNLFWNRTFKTGMQFAFRSVTWKLGNVRGFGAGLTNQARQLHNWGGSGGGSGWAGGGGGGTGVPGNRGATAKKKPLPYIDPGFAWAVFGLPITSLVIATIIQQYNKEGRPRDWKDVVTPRIGGVDSRGKPLRVAMATYLKDIEHFRKHPRQYLVSGFSAMFNRIPELWQNQDFFGNYIVDPDRLKASWYEHLDQKAIAAFEMGSYMIGKPIMLSSFQRNEQMGADFKQQAFGAVGFPRAASGTDFTKAEEIAAEHARRNMKPQTRAEQEKGMNIRRLKEDLIQGVPGAEDRVIQALQSGQISARAASEIRRAQTESYLQRSFRPLPLKHALDVWEVATPEERKSLREMLLKKEHLIEQQPIEDRPGLHMRFKKALGLPTAKLSMPPGASPA